MTRLLPVLAIALAACSGAHLPATTTSRAPDVAPARVGQRELIVVQRPMEHHVAVTVWLDAGSLDGANEALLAAEIVASSSEEFEVAVLPDGTRFRRMCASEELEACVREIDAALALRTVSEADLARARRAVVDRRARGATSSRREAETLAASAALGVELAPLGDAEADVTRQDVEAFLAEHFGAERCLWITVGDVDADQAARALEHTPSRTARAPRRPRVVVEEGPRVRAVEHPEAGHWAIARRVTDEAAALALANAWSRRRALAPGVEVSAFPTRAGWLAMVSFARQPSDDPSRWLDAAPEPAEAAVLDESAWALADRLGARWVAGQPRSAGTRTGIALVGRDAEQATATVDPDASRSPWRDAVRVRVAETTGISIAWALPGPAEDEASMLGASQIAAEILARRCTHDARVRIDGDGVVVMQTESTTRAMAIASRWRDCVALYEPSRDEIEAARRLLVAGASVDDDRVGIAARAISPRAPGIVAARASRQALADISTEDVLARWRSWRDAGRWGFAGAVDAGGGPPTPTERLPELEPTEVHARAAVERPELLIVEAIPGCGEAARGAAIERAWASHARRLGLEITWRHSSAARGLAWAAIAVRGAPSELAAMASTDLDADTRAAATRAADRGALQAHAFLASTSELAHRAAVGAPGARCDARPVRGVAWIEPHPSGPRR